MLAVLRNLSFLFSSLFFFVLLLVLIFLEVLTPSPSLKFIDKEIADNTAIHLETKIWFSFSMPTKLVSGIFHFRAHPFFFFLVWLYWKNMIYIFTTTVKHLKKIAE